MSELVVGLGDRSYPIHIESGLLPKIGEYLAKKKIANRYCIISDSNVAQHYSETLIQSLSSNNIESELITFKAGEQSKNLTTFSDLLRFLAQNKFDRKDGIIALGGGVAGDLAGYVAASYMRSIPYIQIPTTLLSQVDSSVGGKTGVDIPEGKNLVGAFYQPKAVYIDTDVLQTLPHNEFIGGMAEVIKYGVIWDAKFFQYLQEKAQRVLQLESEVIAYIIQTCCMIKAEVVAKDEQESNIRRILNYGHTIGHAIEAESNFSIIHGEAVAMGMAAITRIAVQQGTLDIAAKEEIISLIHQYGLPTEIPQELDISRIKHYLLSDKKVEAGRVMYVVPRKIGEVIITADIKEELVDRVLRGKIL